MPKLLLIDADPGIGDALAITAALPNPELDVIAITGVAGCVEGRMATRNVQAIVDLLDPPKRPRLGGCGDRIGGVEFAFGGQTVDWSQLNGPDGLGGWPFGFADLHDPRESTKLIKDVVREFPHDVTVLTLGPLTNLCRVAEAWPDFGSTVKQVICLGGSVEVGGDVTPAAEFNIYADPTAARSLLRSSLTKTLVPLDVAAKVELTYQQFDRLRQRIPPEKRRVVETLAAYAFRASHQFRGKESVPLPEIVALAAVARPELFESESMSVDVETSGELTRGTTVFDRRGIPHWKTNVEVARKVDIQGILDFFAQSLTGSAL
ncbi:nucleoside hydrolase [Stratiformator vulcanicus]|uniref:Pyrimidine-specific ribonucleoside hydrolase RihA n=1 Tax=Stratiformator vulcanicus TaxID=2527980 RepID=A0A517QYT5_9PLAN|nr:nucleoside hydrolase [Stratiformator vulcanicus]QDT36817.1 Pyrimidine-specific ribonucleoside hydrolase RihA [Stratiformator vulcanicus]